MDAKNYITDENVKIMMYNNFADMMSFSLLEEKESMNYAGEKQRNYCG